MQKLVSTLDKILCRFLVAPQKTEAFSKNFIVIKVERLEQQTNIKAYTDSNREFCAYAAASISPRIRPAIAQAAFDEFFTR